MCHDCLESIKNVPSILSAKRTDSFRKIFPKSRTQVILTAPMPRVKRIFLKFLSFKKFFCRKTLLFQALKNIFKTPCRIIVLNYNSNRYFAEQVRRLRVKFISKIKNL